jgi:hypothetical protein
MAKPTMVNLNDATPAAPVGKDNVAWQASAPRTLLDGSIIRDVSACVPRASTAAYGTVIYDASGAALKYLGADGNWHPVAATKAGEAHKFLSAYDQATGLFTNGQPAVSDLAGMSGDPATYLNGSGLFTAPAGGTGGGAVLMVDCNQTWPCIRYSGTNGGTWGWNDGAFPIDVRPSPLIVAPLNYQVWYDILCPVAGPCNIYVDGAVSTNISEMRLVQAGAMVGTVMNFYGSLAGGYGKSPGVTQTTTRGLNRFTFQVSTAHGSPSYSIFKTIYLIW